MQQEQPQRPKATKTTLNGITVELRDVKFGTRSLQIRDLTIVDQWDIAEIAVTDSRTWRSWALLAIAVQTIDGVPIVPAASGKLREHVRYVLHKLGEDGLAAVAEALAPPEEASAAADPEEAHKSTVGNFSETATSGN